MMKGSSSMWLLLSREVLLDHVDVVVFEGASQLDDGHNLGVVCVHFGLPRVCVVDLGA